MQNTSLCRDAHHVGGKCTDKIVSILEKNHGFLLLAVRWAIRRIKKSTFYSTPFLIPLKNEKIRLDFIRRRSYPA